MGFYISASILFSAASETAVTVDTETLSITEFDQHFLNSLELYKKDMLLGHTDDLAFSELENLKYGILDTLIEEMLFASVAKRGHITVTEKEIRQKLIAMEKAFPWRKNFLDALKRQHIALSQLRKRIETLLVQEKILSQAYPDLQIVTTYDIWVHLKSNSITALPFRYNISFAVTDNLATLETLKTSLPSTEKLDRSGLNEEISSLSLLVKDEDLKPEISAILTQLPLHEFSAVQPFGDRDYFMVRLNEIKGTLSAQFQDTILSIRQGIIEEKKARYARHWIENQLNRQKVTVNPRVFPRYYKRD